jgi:hypothetical protein
MIASDAENLTENFSCWQADARFQDRQIWKRVSAEITGQSRLVVNKAL